MTATSRDGHEAREQIAQTEQAEQEHGRAGRAAGVFDLRRVIGALLAVYGAMLTVMGLVVPDEAKAKAAGININLWAGLAMLLVGAAFFAWAVLRPLKAEELADDAEAERADAREPARR
jgi:hypothetical protein